MNAVALQGNSRVVSLSSAWLSSPHTLFASAKPYLPKHFTFVSLGRDAFKLDFTSSSKFKLALLRTRDLEYYFTKHEKRWKKETRFFSLAEDTYANSNYTEIISYGQKVLPLIFESMEKEDALWFHALRKITGVDPVEAGHAGRVRKMTEDWLSWARKNGYANKT